MKKYRIIMVIGFLTVVNSLMAQDSLVTSTNSMYKTYYDHKKGNVKLIENYTDGVYNGVVAEFYPDGSEIYRINFNMGVVVQDTIKLKYGNNKLRALVPIKDGLVDGTVKVFHKNGRVKVELPFEKGRKSGIAKYYHKRGRLLKEAGFLNGKKHGTSIKYSKGKVIEYANNDTLINQREMYDKKGDLTHYELPNEEGTKYINAFVLTKDGNWKESDVMIWDGQSFYSKEFWIKLPKGVLRD